MVEVTDNASRVYLDAASVVEELHVREHIRSREWMLTASDWHPEFANHMIEAIPSPPYSLNLDSLNDLLFSMWIRRLKIQFLLPPGRYVTSQTAFPRFGLDDFVALPEIESNSGVTPHQPSPVSQSVFVPDVVINPHPRFPTLVANICRRRGAKPFITVPLYHDTRTDGGSSEPSNVFKKTRHSAELDWSLSRPMEELNRFSVEQLSHKTLNPVKDHIYMDTFAFGMGMSCVQTTFTCRTISEARYLYDQLVVLAPLMLALTAATPVLRGLVADTDTRWRTLEQAVDCRTEEEERSIPKSRYSGVSLYIADSGPLVSHMDYLNDTHPPVQEKVIRYLVSRGMDAILARHFGHLWMRDPMVIFAEKIELDDTKAVDHFENIQSTNWNSVRFKPPPPAPTGTSPIGWRVEFRTPELQLTDFENAAGVALISVLAQMILQQRLDLYIPMHMNDLNLLRSGHRNAVTEERFFFRTTVSQCGEEYRDGSVAEMSLNEIFNGYSSTDDQRSFKGLIPMCREFVAQQHSQGRCTAATVQLFHLYSDLYAKRSSGKLVTDAQFLRRFIMEHPDYAFDSVITPTISRDLTVLSINLGFRRLAAEQLYGSFSQQENALLFSALSLFDNERPATELTSTEHASKFSLPNELSFPEFSSPLKEVLAHRSSSFFSNLIPLEHPSSAVFLKPEAAPFHCDCCGSHRCNQCCRLTQISVHAAEAENAPSPQPQSEVKAKDSSATLPNPQEHTTSHPQVQSPATHSRCRRSVIDDGSVSSEDFTRCWILKGFDFIGRGEDEYDSSLYRGTWECRYATSGKVQNALLSHHYTSQQKKDTRSCKLSSRRPESFGSFASFSHPSSLTERVSTSCPSSSGRYSQGEPVGDDLLPDLKEDAPFIDFQTEQDAEYFQQVTLHLFSRSPTSFLLCHFIVAGS